MDVTQKEVEQIAKAFSDAQFQELFQEYFGSSIFFINFVVKNDQKNQKSSQLCQNYSTIEEKNRQKLSKFIKNSHKFARCGQIFVKMAKKFENLHIFDVKYNLSSNCQA
jgi:flagellar motility protein MotE (MotC chaperone)